MAIKKQRLRLQIEFNQDKEEDMELWNILQRYTSPTAYVKDVLRGILPPPSPNVAYPHLNNIKFEELDE